MDAMDLVHKIEETLLAKKANEEQFHALLEMAKMENDERWFEGIFNIFFSYLHKLKHQVWRKVKTIGRFNVVGIFYSSLVGIGLTESLNMHYILNLQN